MKIHFVKILSLAPLVFLLVGGIPVQASGFASAEEIASPVNPFDYHLPDPPVAGDSLAHDFALLHHYQNVRTAAQCTLAAQEINLSLDNAFGPAVGVLTQAEINSVRILSAAVLLRSWPVVYYYKTKYHRLRPYVADRTLVPCIHTPATADASYPSGHSAVGYTLAMVLAKKFPAKSAVILRQGIQIGDNRAIGGVHFPSDVEAGRILAEQIFVHLSDLY